MKSEVKIRELAEERDQLKIRVALLGKENAGLALASENMSVLLQLLKDEVATKKLLLAACKDARDYIGVCDEPALTRMLQEAIDMAEEVPAKEDEVGKNAGEMKQGETETVASTDEAGGDPVAG